MLIHRVLLALTLSACAGSAAPRGVEDWEEPYLAPAHSGDGAVDAWYLLMYRGQKIGYAHETMEDRGAHGMRLTRAELIEVLRGGTRRVIRTELVIDTDRELVAERIAVHQDGDGAAVTGTATRSAAGTWQVQMAGGAAMNLDAQVIPIELVPYLLARHIESGACKTKCGFYGRVVLAGYGFAVAELSQVAAEQRDRFAIELRTKAGYIRSNAVLAKDASVSGWSSGTGVSARRVSRQRATQAFEPVDIVAASSVALRGEAPAGDRRVLHVKGLGQSPPLSLPGQSATPEGEGFRVLLWQLQPKAGEQLDAIAAALAEVPSGRPLDLQACTVYAARFVDSALARGLAARLVTGYRIDGARLLRHRWAIVWIGDLWLTVDPAFGEVPAPPVLIALAVHEPANAHELALLDDVVFSASAAATVRYE